MWIIRQQSQQRGDLGALFAGLHWGTTIYLQALALGDSTTVKHNRTKSTHAGPMIKATLKWEVSNTRLTDALVSHKLGLTVCPEDQRRWWAMDLALCDAVHHHTSIVTHIRGLHLGNVKVSCLLGDETTIVLLNKVRVLIEDPCISEVYKTNKDACKPITDSTIN